MWAVIFFMMLAVDFAWAMYIKALAKSKHLPAALWSMFIASAGGITVIGYTENHLLLIPAVIGGGVGTYLSKYFIS